VPQDCVEFTAAASTCTALGQELYTLTTPAANNGVACTGSSTVCVAGDGSIPQDCVESTAAASTCTALGQELYTLTTPAANNGVVCTGSSTACVAGDGSIPLDCAPGQAPNTGNTACDDCAEGTFSAFGKACLTCEAPAVVYTENPSGARIGCIDTTACSAGRRLTTVLVLPSNAVVAQLTLGMNMPEVRALPFSIRTTTTAVVLYLLY
jgi:hypothetical protein